MTIDHAWVYNSLRCALRRLDGHLYNPVSRRDQYDAILALSAMDFNHRVTLYRKSIGLGLVCVDPPIVSSLDKLLKEIQHP